MTKANTSILMSYIRADKRTLEECYGRYSQAKKYAYNACRRDMEKFEGYDFKIISYNSMMFTCAFSYIANDGTEHLRYYTRTRTVDFVIE